MGLTGKLQELVLRIGEGIVRRVEQDVEAGQILVVEHGIQAGIARHARRARHARHGRRGVGPDRADAGARGVDGLVVVGGGGISKGDGGHFGGVAVEVTGVVEFLLQGC